MRHRGRAALAFAAIALLVVLPAASADPIAGAVYAGGDGTGATVSFTVSASGDELVAYRIAGAPGNSCTFLAEGDAGVWAGTAITGGVFEYDLYTTSLVFKGSFGADGSASGTYQMTNAATDSSPGCTTGIRSWTATASGSAPTQPPGDAGSGDRGPGPSLSGSNRGGTKTTTFHSKVSLRRGGMTKLTGTVTSTNRACRSYRVVRVYHGKTRIALVHTHKDGSYSVRRAAKVHGAPLRGTIHAVVSQRRVASAVCASAMSRGLKL